MEISFTRKQEGNHIIFCKRKDGSVTWKKSNSFLVMHDICHFAVESILQLKRAFYGMLASGICITDFEIKKEQRSLDLTEEALLAEHLVNLLVIEHKQGKVEDFAATIKTSYEIDEKVLLQLKDGGLDKIRKVFRIMLQQWHELDEGEILKLEFED